MVSLNQGNVFERISKCFFKWACVCDFFQNKTVAEKWGFKEVYLLLNLYLLITFENFKFNISAPRAWIQYFWCQPNKAWFNCEFSSDGEVRKIKHPYVFMVTAFWSVFAYVWLYIILGVASPGKLESFSLDGFESLLNFSLQIHNFWNNGAFSSEQTHESY